MILSIALLFILVTASHAGLMVNLLSYNVMYLLVLTVFRKASNLATGLSTNEIMLFAIIACKILASFPASLSLK